MKHALQRLHFIGIGGVGMSGIAELLHRLGHTVSGSDQAASASTARLQALGVRVAIGHAAGNLGAAQAVVLSSAIGDDNPELQAARAAGLPVVQRAQMLAELLRRRLGIAVAGTHGKTSTTGLITTVLMAAGLDPGFVIGGQLVDAGGDNARLGTGEFIVAEADESDASFLHLAPVLAVVTNIDQDHMDTWGHSEARLQQGFVDFIHRLPFYGAAVLCVDDPGVRAVLPRLQRPLRRYGIAGGADGGQGVELDFAAHDVVALPGGRMRFTVQRRGAAPLPVELNLAGLHNVRNALAAVAVAAELGLADAPLQRALSTFGGVGRRFQRWGELPAADGGRYTLIDDYGHHPAEVAAVLAAARAAFAGRRLLLAFQPHRYSRTRDCFEAFVQVLGQADVLCLTEVYAAGEDPLPGADGAALAAALQAAGRVQPVYAATLPALADAVRAGTRGGDVVLTLGAGSIAALPKMLNEGVAAPVGAAE